MRLMPAETEHVGSVLTLYSFIQQVFHYTALLFEGVVVLLTACRQILG
jgi:hypothetical protein